MTFEQLEAIVAVAAEGTILAASEKLNISHTAVSRAISHLESELEMEVFHRSRAGSTLTSKGEKVLKIARCILDDRETMLRLGRTQPPDTLKIGAFPLDSAFFVSEALSAFASSYPETTIYINQIHTEDTVNAVRNGDIDFGLVFIPESRANELDALVKYKTLFKTRVVVLARSDSPLAKKNFVTADDLRNYSFILQEDSYVVSTVNRIFGDNMPNILLYSNNNELIKNTILKKNILSTYSEVFMHENPLVRSGALVYIPFHTDDRSHVVNYVYICRKNHQSGHSEKNLIRLLRIGINHAKTYNE